VKIKNTGFVEFHRPGRSTFVWVLLIPVGVFVFAIIREPIMLILMLVGAPFLMLLIDIISKRRLLSNIHRETSIHTALKDSGIKWLYNAKGTGIPSLDRETLNLPRTVADNSLFDLLQEIEIPEGLTEPEQIRGSIPSNVITSIISSIVCLLIIYGMWRITKSTVPQNLKLFAWIVMLILGIKLCLNVLRLPTFQKHKVLPDFLRNLGRGQLLAKGYVVGPGWIKCGTTVWSAETDMLLIRRTGWRSASAEVVCLLVSKKARKKIRFSGVHDDDFRTLFGFWNIADVRMEFVDSDIS